MSPPPRHATRMFVLLARRSRTALVLRRGPSKRVALIAWDRATDAFEVGQWLNGRIYERRCDLSPDGSKFVYFAASFRGPFRTWTAVSRPPYLTALALWPKGDTYGGGGVFDTETDLRLNHRREQMHLAEGFRVPSRVHITPMGEHAGHGEDFPIYEELLERGGWVLAQRGVAHEREWGVSPWIEYDPLWVWQRSRPVRARRPPVLEMRLRGLKERGGAWYVMDFVVHTSDDAVEPLPKDVDWADWDANGDLLFTRGGSVHRAGIDRAGRMLAPKLLADFGDLAFAPREAPARATRW